MRTIDVSQWQGVIDWNKVKGDGIEAVVIRAGYGRGTIDERFFANIEGAITAGLHVGVYWFSYAYSDDMAINEAKFVCGLLDGYKLDLPVFFDWEYDSMDWANSNGVYPERNLISTMTRAFCEEVERQGYVAGYYLNLDYAESYYNEEILTPYKVWFAYPEHEECPRDCYLWQNSFRGNISGISGNVDMDILYGSLINPSDKPTPAPTPKPIPEPTPEPINDYVVGDVYTVNVNSALNVRTGPGTNYPCVGYFNLTADGKAHANEYGALLPDTRVTCLETRRNSNGSIWMRIPSGWICAETEDGDKYVV